jgi:hypothetical protein
MTKKIHVTIDQMGNPKIEAEGFAGMGCEAATAPIERALAGEGVSMTREMKGEYYASEEAGEQEQQSW